MGFLHPLLLAGLAAIALPILLHLLLRQRPRPRPWAAMRWLQAAAQRASRKWRLTNFLLLLLRCVVVALLAVAVARPMMSSLGSSSGRLVIVVDRTASMGARGDDPGPLAAASAFLQQTPLPFAEVVLLTVDDQVQVVSDGDAERARRAFAQLTPSAVSGGLDHATSSAHVGQIITALGAERPAVLLISDFQQDQGTALVTALSPHARSVSRWSPMPPAAAGSNASIAGLGPIPDAMPGHSGELSVPVTGTVLGCSLQIDDGPAVDVPFPSSVSTTAPSAGQTIHPLTIPLPPLSAGTHRIRARLRDQGLSYDNLLETPLIVRPAVNALLISDATVASTSDYLAAALASDSQALTVRTVRPALIGSEALPPGSMVGLRARLPSASEAGRIAEWVRSGGVLWATARTLLDDPGLAPLLGDLRITGTRVGGAFSAHAADHELATLLALGGCAQVPNATVPAAAEVLLRAGDAPAVIAVPAGRGWVIVEVADLANDRAWQARGSTPLWTQRVTRRYTARAAALAVWTAGDPAVATTTLTRDGSTVTTVTGDALTAAPGAWRDAAGATIVVLPDPAEGRIDRPSEVSTEAPDFSKKIGGGDVGPWLIVAALAVAIGEGLLAAWAGRTYGQ